jgi:hypothetical protein
MWMDQSESCFDPPRLNGVPFVIKVGIKCGLHTGDDCLERRGISDLIQQFLGRQTGVQPVREHAAFPLDFHLTACAQVVLVGGALQ